MKGGLLVVVAQGSDSFDADRARDLVKNFHVPVKILHTDRSKGFVQNLREIYLGVAKSDANIVYLEGTGLRAGLALLARTYSRDPVHYVVSSGDAVDRFVSNRHGILAGWVAGAYERALYRRAAGFIGWSPYLVGRAIRMGARYGITIEGQVPAGLYVPDAAERIRLRRALGVSDGDILVGVTGSLNWSRRQKYAYGLELVEAAARVERDDIKFLIVGGGTGKSILEKRALELKIDVKFLDRVPRSQLAGICGALDLAVLAQTPDEVGLLRLTTKLPEYLAVGTPVSMPATPGAFDYLFRGDDGAALLLPPTHPGKATYWRALADQINSLEAADLASRRRSARVAASYFADGQAGARLERFLSIVETELPKR